MIKRALMRVLGIESTGARLARLEANHRKLMESIVRVQDGVDRLSVLHEKAEGQHREELAVRIELATDRLASYRAQYAEAEIVLKIARDTHEVDEAYRETRA